MRRRIGGRHGKDGVVHWDIQFHLLNMNDLVQANLIRKQHRCAQSPKGRHLGTGNSLKPLRAQIEYGVIYSFLPALPVSIPAGAESAGSG